MLKIKIQFVLILYCIATVLLMPLLLLQVCWGRFNILKLSEVYGKRSGQCGDGDNLKLLIIGDSAAVGVIVDEQSKTLACQSSLNSNSKLP